MRIVVIFDGSDDGFAGLKTLARVIPQLGNSHDFHLVLVGWPARLSPIWDRAFERQRAVDDLHRAMAEVAHEAFERLRSIFSPYGAIHADYLEGEPVAEIVGLIEREKPELALCGLTRGDRFREVNAALGAILERTSVPALTAFGGTV